MLPLFTSRARAGFLATFVALACIGASVWASNASYYEMILQRHGVDASVRGLVVFLENGWHGVARRVEPPPEPPFKSSLLIDAWQLLAYRYDQYLAAAPETRSAVGMVALLYAQGRIPPGALEIVEEDMRSVEPALRADERRARLELLQFNGIIAAGWFAEPDESSRRVLRQLVERETRPLIQVHYYHSLALLGDAEAIDALVAETSKANRTSSVAAANFLSILTGRTFDLTANRAIAPRAEAAQDIIRWRMQNREPIAVDRTRIMERQQRQILTGQERHNLHTLRGLLRASADQLDLADQRGSRTAWNELERMGPALEKHLEPILEDPREDLDIRAEAIRWHVRLQGRNARRRLRKLARDPNPEIVELAKEFLKNQPWKD